MKQLTCEMCGSTDLLKQDGVFVCQSCGCKYSVEEAKKMMTDGNPEVSASPAKSDPSDTLNTYLTMAKNAYEANNSKEAEAYCNRVLEIDPDHYDAWMLKGRAAGWQSSLGNVRLGEAIHCFVKAVQLAPEEPVNIRKLFISQASLEVKSISLALVNLQGERFVKYPDNDEENGMISMMKTIGQMVKLYTDSVHTELDVMPDVLNSVDQAVVQAWNQVALPEYLHDDDSGHPSDYAFTRLLERAGSCNGVLDYAAGLCSNDSQADISRYENLITIHERCINSCSWTSRYETYQAGNDLWDGSPIYANKKVWYKSKNLSASAVVSRRSLIAQYQSKIALCKSNMEEKKRQEEAEQRRKQEQERYRKEQEQKERNEAYWTEHAEEKHQLESECQSLQEELKQLQEQFAPFEREIHSIKAERDKPVPSEQTKNTVMEEISQLREKLGKLGFFKGKEKKTLQEQINALSSQLSSVSDSIASEREELRQSCNAKIREIEEQSNPIKIKLIEHQERIAEINKELTKNR